ncbi:MAG: alpha/beta fold hydrolase [Dehalococcoidia bacterium]
MDWGGDGPPLITIHGGRRTANSWNAVARRLHSRFRVISVDIRGHGDSGASNIGNNSIGRMKDLLEITEFLGIHEHYLMVHSLGTLPGARYAAKYSERVKGFFMIEPIPEGFKHWVRVGTFKEDGTPTGQKRKNGWPSLDELRGRLKNNKQTRNWTEEVLQDVLLYETEILDDGKVRVKWDPSVYNIDEMKVDHFELVDEAESITSPTLLMVIDKNPLIESHFNNVASKLPNASYVIVNGLGHAIYMEAPELIADYAEEFFLNGRLPS